MERAIQKRLENTFPGPGRRLQAEELTGLRPSPELLQEMRRRPVIGILENIRSMWNVGSIFRSADGARLQRLMLCGYTAHPPRKEISKTALGAEKHVPWEYWSRAAQVCHFLRKEGYRILALEHTTTSLPLAEVVLDSPVAFVVGNEAMGISDETLAACDAAVELPMAGMKESLNVSVAFGIAAYSICSKLESVEPDPGPS